MSDDPGRSRPDVKHLGRTSGRCLACSAHSMAAKYCGVCRSGTRAERHAGVHPGYEGEDSDT